MIARRKASTNTILALALGLLLTLAAAMPARASAEVKWDAVTTWAPTTFVPGERGGIQVEVGNAGDETATGWPQVEITLPVGITYDAKSENFWNCEGVGTPQVVTCTVNPVIEAIYGPDKWWPTPGTYTGGTVGGIDRIQFTVNVSPSAPVGIHQLLLNLSGAGATSDTEYSVDVETGTSQPEFGVVPGSLFAQARNYDGTPYTQAGGHPDLAVTGFQTAKKFNDPALGEATFFEMIEQVEPAKDIVVDLPAGFAGNPQVVAECSVTKVQAKDCPPEAQVGIAETNQYALPQKQMFAIYNVTPRVGTPAQFAFYTEGGPTVLTPVLRSDEGWGLAVHTRDITEANPLFAAQITLWGNPADPENDRQRCYAPSHIGDFCAGTDPGGEIPLIPDQHAPHSSTMPNESFLTMPAECDGQPDVTVQHMASWLAPGRYTADGDPDLSDSNWKNFAVEAPPVVGCEQLEFEPTMTARPTTNAADSPTGLDVDLHIPQNSDPDGLAPAHLRKAVVTLPEGLVVNPSGANGLGACAPTQIHLGDRLPDDCPESAKVATVKVHTPVLEDPIPGAVYIATPYENPFGSLLAIYIALDDPKTGIVGKLAGEVTPDPETGRLTATFDDNPQLPFEDFELDFFGGAAASLTTPPTCGKYATEYELTPWSAPHTGPAVSDEDGWELTQGPNGGSCGSSAGELPHAPSMEAGSTTPIAGAHTDFAVNLRREDGSQQFSAVTVTPPPGLVAKLAGTPVCPEAALAAAAQRAGAVEKAMPSCPAASEVGGVVASAGAGPAPYPAHGTVYMAGPYKGAPLSLAIVTPAVAGPFDLGTIVVRTALRVDPRTTQITAVSDPIPHILEGIPLNVKKVSLRIDKPSFALNPTSCRETAVTGSLLSTQGASAALHRRFQVGECARLGFKPNLKLFLKGGTKRSKFPSLTAVLTNRPGDANIASVSVAFPPSEFVAQQHLDDICTRVQFAADSCPGSSVYGTATVTTPLLDYPLTGNVHLRSSSNTLPDLVPDLRGIPQQPIRLESAGRVDSFKKGIRNTFDFVPDAPFTQLVLKMKGGEKGLLENSRNICARKYRALVKFTAHNGRRYIQRPVISVAGCRKDGKGKQGRNGAQGKSRSAR